MKPRYNHYDQKHDRTSPTYGYRIGQAIAWAVLIAGAIYLIGQYLQH